MAAGAGTLVSSACEALLDRLLPGSGSPTVTRIGEGSSNLTYLVERGGSRVVLRRPPPPPLPPSAHDVVREARLQLALEGHGVRVPRVLTVREDPTGSPFYVMEELEGIVITDTLPPATDGRALGLAVVDALVELHAVDHRHASLSGFGRPTGYLERQLRRFSSLYEASEGRRFAAFDALTEQLRRGLPESTDTSVVHGDYRLGNLMVTAGPPTELLAILDWEMATIGDPLADLGYLTVTWSEPGASEHPMLLSPVTAGRGFPSRRDLVRHYTERTGRDVSHLPWYQALALWKSAVFCEAIYGRHLAGERDDAWAASLDEGVPRLIEVAAECLTQA